MVKSRQKSSEKNVTNDPGDPLKEGPRESILRHRHVYPHLPSIPEEKWIDLLQSEDEDHIRYKIKDESRKAAKILEESQHLNKRAFSFVIMCCHMAWMKIIPMNFMMIDPGEESTNFEEEWKADTEPLQSPHSSDFWPVPSELVEKNFNRQLNISCHSDTKSKSESDNGLGDTFAKLYPNISEIELQNLKTKLEMPLSKYMSSEDYLAKWTPIDPTSCKSDLFKKEETEQILKLLGTEKKFIQNVDKFPESIPKQASTEQKEKETTDEEGISSTVMWHRNMEEKVSFIRKLPEHERRHFLPYLPLINEFLEADELDVLHFGNC